MAISTIHEYQRDNDDDYDDDADEQEDCDVNGKSSLSSKLISGRLTRKVSSQNLLTFVCSFPSQVTAVWLRTNHRAWMRPHRLSNWGSHREWPQVGRRKLAPNDRTGISTILVMITAVIRGRALWMVATIWMVHPIPSSLLKKVSPSRNRPLQPICCFEEKCRRICCLFEFDHSSWKHYHQPKCFSMFNVMLISSLCWSLLPCIVPCIINTPTRTLTTSYAHTKLFHFK